MRTTLIILVSCCFSLVANAKGHPILKVGLNDTLHLDPSITYGKLSNGLQYYLKPLEHMEGQIEINFLVKAGYNQEDTDQYTLAHFLEHIVLKAGKHVSTKALYGTELSQELGISRGAINAFTGSRHTQFVFKLPNTDKAVNFGLQLIKDIMVDLEFKDQFIEAERSPFFDESEFRGGEASLQGHDSKLDSKIMGCKEKFPEDYPTYINTFSKDKLVRFYDDWYRPGLMGMIVTGDIKDVDAWATKMEHWFAGVPKHKAPRSHVDCRSSYLDQSSRFVKQVRPRVFTDRFATMLHYRLFYKDRGRQHASGRKRLEHQMKQQLLLVALKERFKHLSEMEDWSFQVLLEYPDEFSSTWKVNVDVRENQSEQALAQVMAVLQQVRTEGITAVEFEKAKKQCLESLISTRSNSNWYWKNELRKYFMDDEPFPAQKNEILRNFIRGISRSDLESFYKESYSSMPQDIGMIIPSDHQIRQVTEETVRGWLTKGLAEERDSFSMPDVPEELMAHEVTDNLKQLPYEELTSIVPGARQYRLANGLELVLKSFEPANDYEKDIILFQGIIEKGANCFPKRDYHSAINSPEIMVQSGIGTYKKWEMKKYMSKRNMFTYAHPYINSNESGIRGRATMKDLETALQLVYLYFVDTRKDQKSFEKWRNSAPFSYTTRLNEDDLRTHVKTYLNNSSFLPLGTKRLEGVKQTDLDRAYDIYNSIFGMVEDYTFMFSGRFDHDTVLQLCNKYLGNLPNNTKDLACVDDSQNNSDVLTARNGKEWESNELMNNTLVDVIYRTKARVETNDWKERTTLAFLANLMDVTLMKKLRFKSEEGGPYSIRAIYQYDYVKEYNEFIIQYSCAPKDLQRLNRELRNVVKDVVQTPFSNDMFETVKREFMPRKEETNAMMMDRMIAVYRGHSTWFSQKQYRNHIDSLTIDDMQRAAIKNLNMTPLEFRLVSNRN